MSWFSKKEKEKIFVPPKTRIRVETRRSGDIYYVAELYCDGLWLNLSAFGKNNSRFGEHGSLEYSKNLIDMWIQTEKEHWEKEAIGVEYIKYP